jgi:hypothetical protein
MKLSHSLVFMSLKRFYYRQTFGCNQQQRFTASAKIKQTTQVSTHGCYIVPSSTKTNCKCRFFLGYGRIWGLEKLSCAYVPFCLSCRDAKVEAFLREWENMWTMARDIRAHLPARELSSIKTGNLFRRM